MTSERIKCPSCGAGLILPDSARGSLATCPRCLAEISTPETGREPDAIQGERPELRAERLRLVESGREDAPDLDVRRDTKGTSCFVVGLAVIGLFGLLFTGWGVLGAAASWNLVPIVYLVVALLFLAGMSALIVFVRSGGNPKAIGFHRVAVGALALVGALILTVVAIFVFFFIACLAGLNLGGGGGHGLH